MADMKVAGANFGISGIAQRHFKPEQTYLEHLNKDWVAQ